MIRLFLSFNYNLYIYKYSSHKHIVSFIFLVCQLFKTTFYVLNLYFDKI